jgi:nucleoside-diphosphate-sugar epimerase
MNILITGIHGFVGSNLVAALRSNHCIYGLDIISSQKEGVIKTFDWNELDSIPPVDVIIHLAGKAHDTKNQTNTQLYFDINTGLTQKIYDWFLSSDAKKFVFFSSVKAATDRVESEILTEDIIPNPKGPYGKSKIAAENYILSHMPATHNPLKEVFILRPCMIHGPGNKGNLNLLYNVVKKGIPYPLGSFENKRSFTSIDNLNFVISELIEKDIPNGIYNVGDDESLSTNNLIALMSKIMNKPNRTWKWNKSLVELCARIGTILHLPLNAERLQKLTENYIVSNAKLKTALGIKKMPVTAQEGFLKTIQSFKVK